MAMRCECGYGAWKMVKRARSRGDVVRDSQAGVQTVREVIPTIDQDINTQLYQRTSEGAPVAQSRGSASRAGSAGSCGRDENRAPNRAEHSNGAKGRAAAPQAGPADNGVVPVVLSDAERLKVTRERMDRLLQSINDNPRHCAPALVQLKSAVRAVPDEVWMVRLSLQAVRAGGRVVAVHVFPNVVPCRPREACSHALRAWLQEQVQHVVSISMKLLLLMYYEVLEDACRMLMELIKARTTLLQPYMQPLIDCLLDVYNALPVEQQPSLMKHVERLMDFMAQHMDVHALMEVRPPPPVHTSAAPGAAQAWPDRRHVVRPELRARVPGTALGCLPRAGAVPRGADRTPHLGRARLRARHARAGGADERRPGRSR